MSTVSPYHKVALNLLGPVLDPIQIHLPEESPISVKRPKPHPRPHVWHPLLAPRPNHLQQSLGEDGSHRTWLDSWLPKEQGDEDFRRARSHVEEMYPGYTFSFLGKGGFAFVFKADSPLETFVVKAYKNINSNSILIFDAWQREGSEHTSDQLYKDLTVLKKLKEEEETFLPKGVRFVNAREGRRKDLMELEFIDGVDLHSYMKNPDVPTAEKEQIQARYRELVTSLHQALEAHPDFEICDDCPSPNHQGVFFEDPIILYVDYWGSLDKGYYWEPGTQIMIKPDNVLLQKGTGDLVIIDPY